MPDVVLEAPTAPVLYHAFQQTRDTSVRICAPLGAEDRLVQSMPDASPTKWHLAHTTWFFETFVLQPFSPDYCPFDPAYGYLFNSYYEAVGQRHPRPQRGLLTRPTTAEIDRYRDYVDRAVRTLLHDVGARDPEILALVELGIHHEQQHQELIFTDILSAFSANPLRPAYRDDALSDGSFALNSPKEWCQFDGGLYVIGHSGGSFAFDNERPQHRVWIEPFRIAAAPVSNADWLLFMEDDGYRRADLWLSDGWALVQAEGWSAPLYWEPLPDGNFASMTLAGMRPIEPSAPVCHVSYYEADAFARWAGCRLPTEAEWERAAAGCPVAGNILDSGFLRPQPDSSDSFGQPRQMFGDVWEWTQSPYGAYPGFRAAPGAVGEYNGKFMCNQFVLRGGSCVTPAGHIRATYRNFFYPHQRWQFCGVRLASDDHAHKEAVAATEGCVGVER